MNFLGANNQETVIFKHSSDDKVKFLPPKSVFHLRYSYGEWFNGTNDENYNDFRKLTDSDWSNAFVNDGITQIVLNVLSFTVNGVVVFTGTEEIFAATNNLGYEFEDVGYGVGCISYINELNFFISNYSSLQTRFYPAAGNRIAGIINTSENFEVSLREVATLFPSTYTLQDNYSIKCEYGNVSDAINGYFLPWSTS